MSAMSFDQLLRASRLASLGSTCDAFGPHGSIRLSRPDTGALEGKVSTTRTRTTRSDGRPPPLSHLLDQRALLLRHTRSSPSGSDTFDTRQRVVVKAHYYSHAGGGAGALKAHARYLARDAASDIDPPEALSSDLPGGETRRERALAQDVGSAHADYLTRGQPDASLFYDRDAEGVNGAARLADWARSDKRHFRLILSAENGAEIGDLPSYAREVMARAGAALGTKLQWVAVDHHDTDNPHTHIVLRGRRANGQDLILPRDFIRHGLRDMARDIATDWLGARTPDQAREALDREIRRHAPTRLDRIIDHQLNNAGDVRISKLRDPGGDSTLTQALKARADELQRMGLSQKVGRNMLRFEPDWRERLDAMERHLNIARRVQQERLLLKRKDAERALRRLGRGLER